MEYGLTYAWPEGASSRTEIPWPDFGTLEEEVQFAPCRRTHTPQADAIFELLYDALRQARRPVPA